jgi:Ca2+-binding RTX toxin-like protein
VGGGTGDDNINGGGGDDLVEVGSGNHTLQGGLGIDTLSFLGGHVEISNAGVTYSLALQGAAQATEQGSMNTSGFENVSGSLYDDILSGNSLDNILLGDLGSDTLSGGDGNDTLYGDGRLWIDGSDSAGGSGAITLFGQQADEPGFNEGDPNFVSGNDTLLGGKGNDMLYGGRGDDVMTGNQGSDQFVIEAGSGDDRITDFSHADKIVFDPLSGVDSFSDLTFTASGSHDTLISWGTGDSILVEGMKPNQLGASDFTFGAPAALSLASVAESLSHGSSFGHGHGLGFDAIDHAGLQAAMQSMV